MKYMFAYANQFSGDVSMWRGVAASNPQSGMFDYTYAFTSKYSCATSNDGPANSCSLIPLTNNNFQSSISSCLSKSSDGMCVSSPYGVMSSWNTSLVTSMSISPHNSSSYDNSFLDLSSWDVSSVTSMNSMFQDQYSMNADVSSWDVSKVTDMIYVSKRIQIQFRYLAMGRLVGEEYGVNVSKCIQIQFRYLAMERLVSDDYEVNVFFRIVQCRYLAMGRFICLLMGYGNVQLRVFIQSRRFWLAWFCGELSVEYFLWRYSFY